MIVFKSTARRKKGRPVGVYMKHELLKIKFDLGKFVLPYDIPKKGATWEHVYIYLDQAIPLQLLRKYATAKNAVGRCSQERAEFIMQKKRELESKGSQGYLFDFKTKSWSQGGFEL